MAARAATAPGATRARGIGNSRVHPSQAVRGLSSLQATLEKLGKDEARYERAVADLAKRLSMHENAFKVRQSKHTQKSFGQSGYVFVKTLGQGRHGLMKLAKRKTSKAHVNWKLQDEYVAVRCIQRFAMQRDVKGKADMLSLRESHATLMKHVHALRELDHPNIQRELETFEDSQQIFIVLSLYSGGDLLEREDKPLPEQRVAWIMDQIVAAMAHAHEKGIVHQDLRPENVRYATKDKDSSVLVTDWSCCEFIASPPETSRKGLIFSDYSAPELEPVRRTDRADMWSIGVLAFALLKFSLPFGAHGPRPQAGDFSWAHADGPRPSADCVSFLEALLRIDPSRRMPAQDALLHPWLSTARRRHSVEVDADLSLQMSSAVANFRSRGTLYRSAYALAAEHLKGEALQKLTETFNLLDTDGDGTIEVADMVQALHDNLRKQRRESADAEVPEELVELFDDSARISALISLMDTDGNGKIGYSEFLAASADAVLQESGAAAWELFRNFDVDNDGIITEAELHQLLDNPAMKDLLDTSHQACISHEVAKDSDLDKAFATLGGKPRTIHETFADIDSDGNRQISFEEFSAMMFA